jgi:hypothetical protein
MHRIITSVLFAGTLALAACGGKGGGDSEAIKAYRGLVKEMCACADADCATKVDKQEQDWRMANYKGLSDGDKEKMSKAREELTKCRDKHKAP